MKFFGVKAKRATRIVKLVQEQDALVLYEREGLHKWVEVDRIHKARPMYAVLKKLVDKARRPEL